MNKLQPDWIFYALLLAAFLLNRIPVAGQLFRGIYTLIHEAAHAFVALLFSGEVLAVDLHSDTSGTTITRSKDKVGQIFVALAGYIMSAAAAWVAVWAVGNQHYTAVLIAFTSIALLLLILSVRNTFGLWWSGIFIVLNLWVLYRANGQMELFLSTFYALVMFAESLSASAIVMVLSFRQPKKSGDAANLQKITKVAAPFWGMIFMLVALFFAYLAIYSFPPFPFLM